MALYSKSQYIHKWQITILNVFPFRGDVIGIIGIYISFDSVMLDRIQRGSERSWLYTDIDTICSIHCTEEIIMLRFSTQSLF